MLKNRQDFAKAFDIYVVVLGVLSIGYYLTCGIVAGFSVNVLFIWLIGGLMLTVYGVAAMILRRNGVCCPYISHCNSLPCRCGTVGVFGCGGLCCK